MASISTCSSEKSSGLVIKMSGNGCIVVSLFVMRDEWKTWRENAVMRDELNTHGKGMLYAGCYTHHSSFITLYSSFIT